MAVEIAGKAGARMVSPMVDSATGMSHSDLLVCDGIVLTGKSFRRPDKVAAGIIGELQLMLARAAGTLGWHSELHPN